jgi:hypothetical protein
VASIMSPVHMWPLARIVLWSFNRKNCIGSFDCLTLIRSYQSLTHGAEPFLRSCQLCSYSKTCQHFMEPEGSLSCSQEPSTGPYPEPDQSNLLSLHFNILHPPTSWSSKWSISFWLSHQYPICIPLLPHSCYMPCPPHPPWLAHLIIFG